MTDPADRTPVETLFSAEEIARRIGEMGRTLGDELPDDALLVSLLGGSVIFLADLVRAIPRPVRYELLHVEISEPPEADRAAGPALALHYPVDFSVEDESLLLLKDVVTTGVTEAYLAEQLAGMGAREVRIAALVDQPEQRKTEVAVDYRAFETARRGILVGYGLEYRGGHGNLPYIGVLRDAG